MKKIKNIKKINFKDKKVIFTILIALLLLIIFTTTIIIAKSKSNNDETIETSGEIIEETENKILEEIGQEGEEEQPEESEKNPEDKTSEKDNNKNTSKKTSTYYVKVNNACNVVTIYKQDENGNYTVPVKAMVCSTGTSTPLAGKYVTPGVRHRWWTLFGHTPGTYVYGQYTTTIVGNILFHSVPYTINGDPSSLEYWEYDRLGTRASAGCIRLTVQDAKWIYDNISKGTTVEFYSDSNPGPLGKPGSQKISGNERCRGWDPTDGDTRNPWRSNTTQAPATTNVQNNVNSQQQTTTNNQTQQSTNKQPSVNNQTIDKQPTNNQTQSNTNNPQTSNQTKPDTSNENTTEKDKPSEDTPSKNTESSENNKTSELKTEE